jgi:peptidoglycan LD-endopeptidase LytH
MPLRLILAALHLAALAIGPAAVWVRARSLRQMLREPDDLGAIRRTLTADAWWGIAAGLWLITGLWRLLAGTEKVPSYYLGNHLFYAKMAMFLAVAAVEVWPMMTLIRWRTGKRSPNARDVGRIEVISYVECAVVIVMMVAAVSMARGYGVRSTGSTTAVADTLHGLGDAPDSVVIAEPAPLASIPPNGSSEASPADLALMHSEIAMPIAGIDPSKLRDNFDEMRGGKRRHEALDIMSPRRTPVVSAAKGRVLKLFTSKNGGLMVYAADSSERFILMYAHLDGYAPGVKNGMALERGQLIGYVGSTGNALAAAPHLHFAVARSADVRHWSSGTPVNPLPLLK